MTPKSFQNFHYYSSYYFKRKHGKNFTKIRNEKVAVDSNKHMGDLEWFLLQNTVRYMAMFTQNAIAPKAKKKKKITPRRVKPENWHGGKSTKT